MKDSIIKQATLSDLNAIIEISHTTFAETFAHLNKKEDIDHYLTNNFSESNLAKEINDPDSFFYLIFQDKEVAGYLKLNVLAAQTEKAHSSALEIERIYVSAKYHGRRFGKKLLTKALEIARSLNKDYVWLGVWEKNEKAINFYIKNNFVRFGEHAFQLGEDEQTDYLYKLKIK